MARLTIIIDDDDRDGVDDGMPWTANMVRGDETSGDVLACGFGATPRDALTHMLDDATRNPEALVLDELAAFADDDAPRPPELAPGEVHEVYACRYVFNGCDTDGTPYYLCTKHDDTALSIDAPCSSAGADDHSRREA